MFKSGFTSSREDLIRSCGGPQRHALQFELPLGDSYRELFFNARETLDFSRRDFLFVPHSRPFALDPGQISIRLRDLIPDGRCFAEQTKNRQNAMPLIVFSASCQTRT